MTGAEYTALAYAVVFVTVLAYVVIIAAKLQRLQRETAALLDAVQRGAGSRDSARTAVYAATVPRAPEGEEEAR